jgi:hypothetical protein
VCTRPLIGWNDPSACEAGVRPYKIAVNQIENAQTGRFFKRESSVGLTGDFDVEKEKGVLCPWIYRLAT